MAKSKAPKADESVQLRVYTRQGRPGKSYLTVETIADMLHAHPNGVRSLSADRLRSTLQARIGDPNGVRVRKSDVRRAAQIVHFSTNRVVDLTAWKKWRAPKGK